MKRDSLIVTGSVVLLGLACLGAGSPAAAGETSDETGESWTVRRVGGSTTATVTRAGESYRSGPSMIESPLPEGYPAPTPPGAIDLKKYPSVRLAKVSGDGTPDRRGGGGFFPLFNHIQRNEIAMTSPVVMDYDGMVPDAGGDPTGWTMAFLYRSPDLGPTGTDPRDGRVEVIDTEPITVVSVGLRGPYGMQTVERGLALLNAWLDGQGEWEISGDPRSLSYNGPYVPNATKWSEVQVPVRRAQPPADRSPDFMSPVMKKKNVETSKRRNVETRR